MAGKQSLTERMLKLGDKNARRLDKSEFLNDKDVVKTSIPAVNVAMSAAIDGGMTSGLTQITGKSKHFKSLLGLVMVKAYMDKYPDSVCIFMDNEFGSGRKYFDSMGIDKERVVHAPFTNIEELKFNAIRYLDGIERGERVFFFIDSVGNAASKKEIEDARRESDAADMTRAKQIKSVFRIITPHLTMKDLHMIAINHVYDAQDNSKSVVVSGGTGIYLSSDTVIIMGRQQVKTSDKKDLLGYDFIMNIDKSRYVKEKAKIPLCVKFDGGIDPFSGFFEWGLAHGSVVVESKGWYTRPCVEGDKKWRKAETSCQAFWQPIFEKTDLKDFIGKLYGIADGSFFDDSLLTDENGNMLAVDEDSGEIKIEEK